MALKLICTAALSCIVASAQPTTSDLSALGDPNRRQQALETFVKAGESGLTMLLSAVKSDGARGVEPFELRVGLAEAFAAIASPKALPFLVANVSIERHRIRDAKLWFRSPREIREALPAVDALIKIGPAAIPMLIERYHKENTLDERLAILFVCRTIGGTEASEFLRDALRLTTLERRMITGEPPR